MADPRDKLIDGHALERFDIGDNRFSTLYPATGRSTVLQASETKPSIFKKYKFWWIAGLLLVFVLTLVLGLTLEGKDT